MPTLGALAKIRLNALVLVTTAVGAVVASPAAISWGLLGWTLLGTAASAASASMFNQLIERRRDALMRRTASRPLPQQRIGPLRVFVLACALAYAGWAVLLWKAGWIPAALATGNVLVYAMLYTPLKPLTSLNTLVGAVCGAIPPMVGWTAVTGSVDSGAWIVAGILFVWQLPHFMALAWMYREDYERGGFVMLPARDPSGSLTAQTMLLTSLTLVPMALLATLHGLAGVVFALCATGLGLWLSWESFRFLRVRSDAMARRVFLVSIVYLPLLLLVMLLDRGPVSPAAGVRMRGVIDGGDGVLQPNPSTELRLAPSAVNAPPSP
ncbi:MAG: heme o synthase [Planctomycetota bacterium]